MSKWICNFWVGKDAFERAYYIDKEPDSSFESDDNRETSSLFKSYLLSVLEDCGQDANIVYTIYTNGVCYVNPTKIDIHGSHKWIYKE